MKTIGTIIISKEKVFEQVKNKWYVQGFNGTPFLSTPCGTWSGFDLDETVGDAFQHAFYGFKEGVAKMYYPVACLERICKKILTKIKKDGDFFHTVEKKYQKTFDKAFKDLLGDTPTKKKFKQKTHTLSNSELVALMKKALNVLRMSVGQGHSIEPFSLTTDRQLLTQLRKFIPNKKELNKAYSILSAPTKRSFIGQREADLGKIAQIKDNKKRGEAIKHHLEKFFWIKNSFSGKVELSPEQIEDELPLYHNYKESDLKALEKKQKKLITQYVITGETLTLIEATKYVSLFQDNRKVNMLKSVHYAEIILEELSERLDIDIKLLRYLSAYTFKESIFDNKNLKNTLEARQKGTIMYHTVNGEAILTGKDYKNFCKALQRAEGTNGDLKQLNGLSASVGTALGKVRICSSLDDINNFTQGDILVASMTKVEFLPAMRKAAAIITDEGGITCHAAIVSREFGIPCIIGTKIATKTLHNGDLVEVKANHGVVIIREKVAL
jgi:phosphoenolpyruvate synthase/pyruvate phosphate dikinase